MTQRASKTSRSIPRRDIGAELLQSVREIKAGRGRRFVVAVPEAVAARQILGATKAEFANLLGVSLRTLQDWERGRREPSGAAKTLLKVAVAEPSAVRRALHAA